jgi:hypothetical protein
VKSNGFAPPPPPGSSGANPDTPRIASRRRVGRPGCPSFFLGTRIAEAPNAPRLQRWCSSVSQNHHPSQLAAQSAFHIHWTGLVSNINHRSPHLRLADAHFHHFLGHISQALQRAGYPAANFRISDLAARGPLTALALGIWAYLSSFKFWSLNTAVGDLGVRCQVPRPRNK